MGELFTRAARILRQSTKADGVVFLDATSQIFQTEAPKEGFSEGDLSAADQSNDPDLSDPAGEGRRSFRSSRHSQARSSHDTDAKFSSSGSDSSPTRQTLCDIFGASLKEEEEEGGQSTPFSTQIRDLKRYLKRYPHGKIFNLLEDASSSENDSTSDLTDSTDTIAPSTRLHTKLVNSRNKKRRFHKTLGMEFSKRLPGVRSVVFLPIWDVSQDRWLAGAFLWTAQKGRLLEAKDEIPYLKAFANSITSEVARLTSMHSERAKTTFIASISHELRSPLHGILGSIEFLHDTSVDAYQNGLINSVETCGKTLLDTINHVLDYAGINDFACSKDGGSYRKGQPKSRWESNTDMSPNLIADFDLAVLVEEVTDAIFAGRMFGKFTQSQSLRYTARQALPRSYSDPVDTLSAATESSGLTNQDNSNRAVMVLLNIAKDTKWEVRSQPGALRRIIMNLLGNAMKYTEKGFVEVSLKSQRDHGQNSRVSFELKFTDSGRGMSEEYQREKLFRPFTQEDPFAEGTGLGLSIVRQIVDSLKGKIKVTSQQNFGTEVVVSFSLPVSRPLSVHSDHRVSSSLTLTRAEAIVYLKRLDALMSLYERHVSTGFGMHVTKAIGTDISNADIALFVESPPADYFWRLNSEDSKAGAEERLAPIVILCQNAYETSALKKQLSEVVKSRRVFQVIAQPCGPRKLTMAFEQCLQSKPQPAVQTLSISDHGITESPQAASPAVSNEQSESHVDTTTTKPNGYNGSSHAQPTTSIPRTNPPKPTTSSTKISNHTSDALPRILLVDDNAINLRLLTTFMSKLHYPHSTARDGLEALNTYKAADGAFDFVLMDISMPVMDGLTATREIRKWERERGRFVEVEVEGTREGEKERPEVERKDSGIGGGEERRSGAAVATGGTSGGSAGVGAKGPKATTILALTGLASASARDDAFASGVDGFLPKPVVSRS